LAYLIQGGERGSFCNLTLIYGCDQQDKSTGGSNRAEVLFAHFKYEGVIGESFPECVVQTCGPNTLPTHATRECTWIDANIHQSKV